jgi:hypothetical protein
MPEGLSPEESQEAEDLRIDLNKAASRLSRAEGERATTLPPPDLTDEEFGNLPDGEIDTYQRQYVADQKANENLHSARQANDAALWRAHQPKEQNIDKYIATAKNMAEAEGHEINLDPHTQAAQDRLEEQELKDPDLSAALKDSVKDDYPSPDLKVKTEEKLGLPSDQDRPDPPPIETEPK